MLDIYSSSSKQETPYNPSFPRRARELGGTWDAGRQVWWFELTKEEQVAALCDEIYGPPGFKESATPHYHGHRQRLRERVLEAGPDTLPDYELLEGLLFTHDTRRDTKPLAKDLIERFGGFAAVFEASREDLVDAGVSHAGAACLRMVREASVRLAKSELGSAPLLGSWDKLIDYCSVRIANRKIEEFHVLFLDRQNALLKDERLGKGTVNHTPVYIREVIKRALELAASAMILVHNHPSGDPTPSREDIAVTFQLVAAAKTVNIAVHDHIIIGRGMHVSFRDLGFHRRRKSDPCCRGC